MLIVSHHRVGKLTWEWTKATGPSCLVQLMSGGEDIAREQSGRQEEGERKWRTLQQSELTAYKSCLFVLSFFFLARVVFLPWPQWHQLHPQCRIRQPCRCHTWQVSVRKWGRLDWLPIRRQCFSSTPQQIFRGRSKWDEFSIFHSTFALQLHPQQPTWKGSHTTRGPTFITSGGADMSTGPGFALTISRLPLATETTAPAGVGEYCYLCSLSRWSHQMKQRCGHQQFIMLRQSLACHQPLRQLHQLELVHTVIYVHHPDCHIKEAVVLPPTVHHAPTIPGLPLATETTASAGIGEFCCLRPPFW